MARAMKDSLAQNRLLFLKLPKVQEIASFKPRKNAYIGYMGKSHLPNC